MKKSVKGKRYESIGGFRRLERLDSLFLQKLYKEENGVDLQAYNGTVGQITTEDGNFYALSMLVGVLF